MGVTSIRVKVDGIRERGSASLRRARARWPLLDQVIRAYTYYGEVLGDQLAAGIAYFAFLSFFPLVALAYAAVGYLVEYVPDASATVTDALREFLPGMIGDGSGQIDVTDIASKKAGVGLVGLIGLLYTGLGWISALRTALQGVVAGGLVQDQRNFFVGKAMDFVVLVSVGGIALVSVTVGTSVSWLTRQLVGWLGLEGIPGMSLLLWTLGIVVGIASTTVAFFATYRLLPKDPPSAGSLWRGALVAAAGFEVLRQLAGLVIGQVTGNVLYGAFAVVIALLVWMNYTGRLVVLGAAWAVTRDQREAENSETTETPETAERD